MNNQLKINQIREEKQLKGVSPVAIKILKNVGHIIKGSFFTNYILTIIKEKFLYFHYLTPFFNKYDKSHDFGIKLIDIKSFSLTQVATNLNELILYTVDHRFLPINFTNDKSNENESFRNMMFIISVLREKNIKEEKNN